MSQIGMLSWFTKKPAKSMNGIIRIGVKVTANCLSANNVEMINAYEPADAYIKIKIPTMNKYTLV